jgi:hypothetical protein
VSADRYMADAARILLMTLDEKADLTDGAIIAIFGAAARGILATAWSSTPENSPLATAGIRSTARSYGSDPAASRALLQRIVDDRFEEHASQEAPWLAEGVTSIIPYDSVFVAMIYTALFNRDVTDVAKTWMGGSASRILPLTSTHRQDYQRARWHLSRALRPFLDADPMGGTAAVVGAMRGLGAEKRRTRDIPREPTDLIIAGQPVRVVDDLLSLEDWREARAREEEALAAFVDFLRSCPPDAFRIAVTTTLALPANAAVWARLLGVAAERPGVCEDLLWPMVSDPHFSAMQGLARRLNLPGSRLQRAVRGRPSSLRTPRPR